MTGQVLTIDGGWSVVSTSATGTAAADSWPSAAPAIHSPVRPT
ncbi:MAG: hypothetical protein WKF78_05500 [Candidatus Limnocylindrales bacterium]